MRRIPLILLLMAVGMSLRVEARAASGTPPQGTSLRSDFNNDGFDDLAVARPGDVVDPVLVTPGP